MAKITALDFVKKVSLDSDDIPVEIRDAEGILIAAEKNLWLYAVHGGLELDRKIRSITVRRDVIIIRVQ